MGARGPKTQPTKLAELRGNPGKRKLNQNEPHFEQENTIPGPPDFLDTQAKKEWKRIAPELHLLGLLAKVDYNTLAAYCHNYSIWIQATRKIKAYASDNDGKLSYIGPKGNRLPIPEIAIANDAMKLMKDFASEFGMTPSSRTKVSVNSRETEEDPLLTFLKGGKKSG